jgi:hypothetical protein
MPIFTGDENVDAVHAAGDLYRIGRFPGDRP